MFNSWQELCSNIARDQMLTPLTDHISYLPADHRTDRPILAAVVGDGHMLMIDAGASPRHADLFFDGLRQVTDRRPDWIVLTHWHWDHTFALAHVAIPAIGQTNLTRNLARLQGLAWDDESLAARVRAGTQTQFDADNIRAEYGAQRDIRIALPALTFEESLSVHFGGITCEFWHVPTDHTDDAVVIYVREDKTLFLGDALGPHFGAPARYYTAAKMRQLLAFVRSFEVDWYVESHGLPAQAEAFWRENEILELVANLVEEGITDHATLLHKAAERATWTLPSDVDAVIDYFLNGQPSGNSDNALSASHE
jgi:glyoxylase-like metal-dependent hydrolase (beta-lactamase superfamily II)